MNVKTCKLCKRLFNYINGLCVCPSCKDTLEKRFTIVKDYVYDHPGASIQEVSEECEVHVEQIKQWIRDERLELAKDSQIFLLCKGCNTQIRTGIYCENCKKELKMGFNNILKTNERRNDKSSGVKTDTTRMRYLTK